MWISEVESALLWLGVCNVIKNRGVQEILMACRDNLSGFSDTIETVFPRTEQQLCVIHQIRKLIYTTNAVEGFHRICGNIPKKSDFHSDEALRKSLYLAINEITKKWSMHWE
ncbi:MAG TPA: hypothetical protein GXZ66_00670 [Clostridiaceae bacterium]|nr:hypothetical protein [Clostridiaceae bacterium]